MKKLLVVCIAIGFVVGLAGSAGAAEPTSAVSNSTLTSMGLGGMQAMSDQEGMAVRGKGVIAFGLSFASRPGSVDFHTLSLRFPNFGGLGTFAIVSTNHLAIAGGFAIGGGF
jgi:hypothetical protein